MTWTEQLPVLLVISLLLTSYTLPLVCSLRYNLCGHLTAMILFLVFGGTILLTRHIMVTGPFTYHLGGWAPPWGIELTINPLSAFMLLIITGISAVVIVYTISDIEKEVPYQVTPWYYTLYLLLVAAMAGIALSNDLFNLYVFIEVVGISACALVVARGKSRSTVASLRYLILAAMGSGFILLAVGLLYMITGYLNMEYVMVELQTAAHQYPHVTWAALSFFLVGLGIKCALFPIHVWLPDAHSTAPSFSSALLSGLVVKIYLFALIKILYSVFGPDILGSLLIPEILSLLGAAGIIFGSLFALSQLDIKRMLAYSTVAQIGYIALGLGLNNALGLTAALFHILNHAIIKGCLFLAAGAIIHHTGERTLSSFNGLAAKMPLTMAAFSLGSLSLIGIPLLNGFITKLYLIQATIAARQPLFLMVIIASTLLNAAYLFPIIRRAYFGNNDQNMFHDGTGGEGELPRAMLFSILVLALGIVIFGLIPAVPLALIEPAVEMLLSN